MKLKYERLKSEEEKTFQGSFFVPGMKLEDVKCKLCDNIKREVLYLPCRHFLVCMACASKKFSSGKLVCEAEECKQVIKEFANVIYVEYAMI